MSQSFWTTGSREGGMKRPKYPPIIMQEDVELLYMYFHSGRVVNNLLGNPIYVPHRPFTVQEKALLGIS